MSNPTQFVTPRQSSTCIITPPSTVRVKIEPGVQAVIDLSESSEDVALHAPAPLVSPIPEAQPPLHTSLSPLCTPALKSLHASSLVQSQCIVQSLRKLTQMPGYKNILKRLDYNKIKTMEVEFLPPTYDGDVFFVLPAMDFSSSHSKAKSMFDMDKRYNGHVWTKTVTTNISNVLDLSFRSSSCVGHLCCENPLCEYLERAQQTSSNNDTEFEGVTKEPFFVGGPSPSGSTLVCKICKMPPPNVWHCAVLGSSTSMEMTRVRGLTFILVITAIMLKLAIIGKVARRLMHSLRSMLNRLHKQRSVKLSWRQARTSLVSTLFVMRMIDQLSYF